MKQCFLFQQDLKCMNYNVLITVKHLRKQQKQTVDLSVRVEVKTRAKVRKHNVTLAVNKNVVWFDVSMYIAKLVKTVNSQHHLSQVEPCHVLRQTIFKLRQQCEEVATAVVVHHKVLITSHLLQDPVIPLHISITWRRKQQITGVLCNSRRYNFMEDRSVE